MYANCDGNAYFVPSVFGGVGVAIPAQTQMPAHVSSHSQNAVNTLVHSQCYGAVGPIPASLATGNLSAMPISSLPVPVPIPIPIPSLAACENPRIRHWCAVQKRGQTSRQKARIACFERQVQRNVDEDLERREESDGLPRHVLSSVMTSYGQSLAKESQNANANANANANGNAKKRVSCLDILNGALDATSEEETEEETEESDAPSENSLSSWESQSRVTLSPPQSPNYYGTSQPSFPLWNDTKCATAQETAALPVAQQATYPANYVQYPSYPYASFPQTIFY